jgi:tryptophan-rich sensory protein
MVLRMRKIIRLIGCMLICHAVGAGGALFSRPAIPAWYQTLAKPGYTPPQWVFAPVWLMLYTLIGVALFVIWTAPRTDAAGHQRAVTLFFAQLALNLLWSAVFFGMRFPGGGVVILVMLWGVVGATIWEFGKISRLAAWLMIPYGMWLSFAVVLNAGFYAANR